mmetsp:Transcript_22631/g.66727  ORF Transcript_22631/g.66727 Transcript_22631/m.66727 type:complete len:203 (-) Transcript_22631:635-1243(-)
MTLASLWLCHPRPLACSGSRRLRPRSSRRRGQSSASLSPGSTPFLPALIACPPSSRTLGSLSPPALSVSATGEGPSASPLQNMSCGQCCTTPSKHRGAWTTKNLDPGTSSSCPSCVARQWASWASGTSPPPRRPSAARLACASSPCATRRIRTPLLTKHSACGAKWGRRTSGASSPRRTTLCAPFQAPLRRTTSVTRRASRR